MIPIANTAGDTGCPNEDNTDKAKAERLGLLQTQMDGMCDDEPEKGGCKEAAQREQGSEMGQGCSTVRAQAAEMMRVGAVQASRHRT